MCLLTLHSFSYPGLTFAMSGAVCRIEQVALLKTRHVQLIEPGALDSSIQQTCTLQECQKYRALATDHFRFCLCCLEFL